MATTHFNGTRQEVCEQIVDETTNIHLLVADGQMTAMQGVEYLAGLVRDLAILVGETLTEDA